MDDKALLERAAGAVANAYSPYSGIAVGAAVEMADGSVFAGANIENASLGLTLCAERAALAAAVSEGHRRWLTMAVSLHGGDRANLQQVPCGACLQFMAEFADDDARIITGGGQVARLGDFLSSPFRMHKCDD